MFSCEFCEISKNTFSTEHLRTTPSEGYFCRKLESKIASSSPKYVHLRKAGLYDGLTKCKEKVLNVSDPNQNVETTCNNKFKFTKPKDLFIKGRRKTGQKCIMYVANTAILKLRIFSGRNHCRLWVFASAGEYFYY